MLGVPPPIAPGAAKVALPSVAALIDVLQPNPVLVVQISALELVLQVPTANAVGTAAPAVALPATVLVACVAKLAKATEPTVKAAPELAC